MSTSSRAKKSKGVETRGNDETLNVVFGIDKNYQLPMLVALTTLVETYNDQWPLHISIITSDKDTFFEQQIHQIAKNIDVKFYYFDLSSTNLPFQQNGHLSGSIAQYYRLFLTKILPDSMQRVIYLDCDLLIQSCIGPLWRLGDKQSLCLAATDGVECYGSVWNETLLRKLNIPPSTPYFNSGVMVINLALWRQHEICERALNFHVRYGGIVPLWDQCALNFALINHWKKLDRKWNSLVYINCYDDNRNEPKIVHFAGAFKPWKYRSFDKYALDFYQAYKRSNFDKVKYDFTLRLDFSAVIETMNRKYFYFQSREYIYQEESITRIVSRMFKCLFKNPLVFTYVVTKFFKKSIKQPRVYLKKIIQLLKRSDSGPASYFVKCQSAKLHLELKDLLPPHGFTDGFCFVQIGAHDGRANDPVFELAIAFDWRGILVEPQAHLIPKLKRNYYGCDGIHVFNGAVMPERGTMKLYSMKDAENSQAPWASQIASFKKNVILSHESHLPGLRESLVETEVEVLTFSDLLQLYNFTKVDLLVIDTEGCDFEILKSINFEEVKPEFIRFEHKHLSRNDFFACCDLLVKHGYKLMIESDDTFAKLCDFSGSVGKLVSHELTT